MLNINNLYNIYNVQYSPTKIWQVIMTIIEHLL